MVQCLRVFNFFIVSALLLSHKTTCYSVYIPITREQPSVPTEIPEIQEEKEEESQIKKAQPVSFVQSIASNT